MASEDCSRILQHIGDIARSIPSHDPFTTSIASPSVSLYFDIDCRLPSPPSIVDALSAKGLKLSIAQKVSNVYNNHARQLKDATEGKLRRTIHVCGSINTHFSMPSYDSRHIRAVMTDVYLKTLRRMAADAFLSVENHLSSLRPPFALMSPRVKVAHMGFSNFSICTLLPSDSRSSGHKKCHTNPVYKIEGVADSKNTAWCDDSINAFPARYVHSKVPPSSTMACSSIDFFPDRTQRTRRLPAKTKPAIPETMIETFRHLSFDESQFKPKAEESEIALSSLSDSVPNPYVHPCRHPHSSQAPSSRQPTQVVLNDVPARVRPTRRISPLPSRQTLNGDKTLSHNSECSPGTSTSIDLNLPHALSSQIARSSHTSGPRTPSHSLNIQSDPSVSASPSKTGRRKVAPLPRRQPLVASVSRGFSSSSSGEQHSTTSPSRPLASVVSRTPSLLSLRSSGSASPTPSEDDLDTPPSSPSTRTVHLPAVPWAALSTKLPFNADYFVGSQLPMSTGTLVDERQTALSDSATTEWVVPYLL